MTKITELPTMSRNDLPKFFVKQGFKTGAEIGVYRGDFTEKFLSEGLFMYAIDHWQPYDESTGGDQRHQDHIYRHAQKRLSKYPNVTILKKPSLLSLNDIPDKSLDFVYIDGGHRFKDISNDIYEWSNKVRVGGFVCGHDYTDPNSLDFDQRLNIQVKPVVDAYVESFAIDELFILGRRRDRHKSWMFKKDLPKDDLTQLAIKYGTDRHPDSKHSYTPFYYDLFKNRRSSVKKLLEIGVGEGPGLRMWQDFFPNANIYGAEVDPKRLFFENRIKVLPCNQSSWGDLANVIQTIGSDLDIVIDDGSHKPEDQIFTCLALMPLLTKEVTYLIEDVADLSIAHKFDDYDIQIPHLLPKKSRYDDHIILVRHKK